MVEVERIADPSLLQDSNIIIGLSNLSNETSKPSSESISQAQQVNLVLLQPLANPDMLEACRSPGSRLVHKPSGFVRGPSKHEYLNIQPLSMAWRQALMKVSPISYLTFDLALPKEDEKSKGKFQKLYWDTAMPEEASLGIHTRDIVNLIITIATATRMRAGGDIRFDIVYDETETVSLRAMTGLKKQLLALAEIKTPGVKDREVSENRDNVE